MSARFLFSFVVLSLIGLHPAWAETVRVAVAANFAQPAERIADAFHTQTKHHAVLSFGSTGVLFAQISQGAPHDVFLAADAETADRAEADQLAVAGSGLVYAVGRLAFYRPGFNGQMSSAQLTSPMPARLAIANPVTAPYGRAAMEVLNTLRLTGQLSGRIVRGNSIAQTFQFVATGNADAGFVALSQVINRPAGAYWLVPQALHAPIVQRAVLLETGRDNPAAVAFLAFLRRTEARAIIRRYGYSLME